MAEVERAITAKQKQQKMKAQERASFDYILADLIGRSVARIYSSSNSFPEITEIYPNLFDNKEIEEEKQKKKAELSLLRFKMFVNSHNSKFKRG